MSDTMTITKMDPVLKERWIAALLSGGYEQGRSALRREDPVHGHTYCCLGVLADLIDPTGWERLESDSQEFWKGSSMTSMLPSDVCGIDLGIQHSLARANDGAPLTSNDPGYEDRGTDFATIAGWIRDNL